MIHKGNEIIEIRDYLLDQLKDLSLQEWRLLGYYLEKINPRDINTRYVRIDLDDYLEIMGLGEDANIPYLKASTKKLLLKVIDGKDPQKKNVVYSQTTLFQRCRLLSDEKGKYYFELNAADDSLPLLFDFKDHYIKARGMNIFELDSPNQILMYFYLCKQNGLGRKTFEVPVDELRDWLGIKPNEYQRFGNFNERVLCACEKALKEHSELYFTYEKGRLGAHGKCETLKILIKENKKISKQTKSVQLPDESENKENEEIRKVTELCEKCFNKKINPIEFDWLRSWIKDYGMTEEIVKRAIKDNSFRNYLTMKNIDDTLTKWHENGVKTLEDAEAFCQKEYEANKLKAARKTVTRSAWPTGAEAGILWPEESSEKETKNEEIPEDILDMFADDEEPDESPDI